jgi:hypothetical protein
MSIDADKARNGNPVCVPVPEVLTTISDEVRLLSDSVADLQDLIGNLVVAGAFGGSHSLYELQCLDRLCQNLEAIAEFLGGVAAQSSSDWQVNVSEAAKAVKLAEISERLNGVGRTLAEETRVAGEFEDFEDWSLTG